MALHFLRQPLIEKAAFGAVGEAIVEHARGFVGPEQGSRLLGADHGLVSLQQSSEELSGSKNASQGH